MDAGEGWGWASPGAAGGHGGSSSGSAVAQPRPRGWGQQVEEKGRKEAGGLGTQRWGRWQFPNTFWARLAWAGGHAPNHQVLGGFPADEVPVSGAAEQNGLGYGNREWAFNSHPDPQTTGMTL